jgi:hypothetical protein
MPVSRPTKGEWDVDRRLVRLDLATAREQPIATLPELRHTRFAGGDEAFDPIDYVQREEDIVVDVAKSFSLLHRMRVKRAVVTRRKRSSASVSESFATTTKLVA